MRTVAATRQAPFSDLTTRERDRVLAGILDQQGAMIAREANRNYAGSGSSDDFLMDLIVKILASPPDILAEYGQPAGPWVNRVISNKRKTPTGPRRATAVSSPKRTASPGTG